MTLLWIVLGIVVLGGALWWWKRGRAEMTAPLPRPASRFRIYAHTPNGTMKLLWSGDHGGDARRAWERTMLAPGSSVLLYDRHQCRGTRAS